MLIPRRVRTSPRPGTRRFSDYERRYANRTFSTGTMYVPRGERLRQMRAEIYTLDGVRLHLDADTMLSPRRIHRVISENGRSVDIKLTPAEIADTVHQGVRFLLSNPAYLGISVLAAGDRHAPVCVLS